MAATPVARSVSHDAREPNILVRILWFLFVGWWATQLVSLLAILCSITIVGIPAAFWLLNRIPMVATLKRSKVYIAGDGTALARGQRRWWVRTIWYVCIGWWATAIWVELAWLLMLTVVGLPLAFVMYGFVGKLLTLKR